MKKIFQKFLILLLAISLILMTLRIMLFRGSAESSEELPPKSVIDIHCHVAGTGAGDSGNFLSESIRNSFKYSIYLRAFQTTEKEIEERGDQIVVQKISKLIENSQFVRAGVLLALDGVMDAAGQLDREKTEVYINNEFVRRESDKYPNLYYGASINPYRKHSIQLLEKAKKDGAVLIKWLPAIQKFDPADPVLIPFYQKMTELNLPLLSHTGNERSFTHSRDELGDPARLRLPLTLGVTVIAAHVATTGKNRGEDNVERLAKLMVEFPHLYSEISTLTQINKKKYLRKIIKDKRFQNKLLYGSDYPLMATPLVSPYFFPLDLRWRKMRKIAKNKNPWDRDIKLKQALGIPKEVFLPKVAIFAF